MQTVDVASAVGCRWLEVLQMVVKLELPEPVTPLPMSPLTPGVHVASPTLAPFSP